MMDDSFRAIDALGLSNEVWNDYSQLMDALKERFAPTTCQFELRFCLRHCTQQEGESSDDFASAPTREGNRSLPDIGPKARSEIIQDQFIEGIHSRQLHTKTPTPGRL